MRRNLSIFLLAICSLSCRESADDFALLKIGHTAIYDVEYVAPLTGLQHTEAIQRVEGKQTIGQHEYYKVVELVRGVPGVEPGVSYQRTEKDGLYVLRYVDGKPIECLALPSPMEIGRSWSVDTGKGKVTCRIESKEPAILPAKTYNDAYKVSCEGKSQDFSFTSYTYQVRGVGAVRSVQKVGEFTLEMRLREVEKGGA